MGSWLATTNTYLYYRLTHTLLVICLKETKILMLNKCIVTSDRNRIPGTK